MRRRLAKGVMAVALAWLVLAAVPVQAQTLTLSNAQVEWKVVNRFRLFKNPADFTNQENAWRQYKIHVNNLNASDDQKSQLIATTSVTGTEHVLNDRYIAFTRHLRTKYDPLGWAAKTVGDLCWDAKSRTHSACGGVDSYVMPQGHEIEMQVRPLDGNKLLQE